MLRANYQVFRTDIKIVYYDKAQLLQPVFFLSLISMLFVFVVEKEQDLIKLAPGILWVSVLLVVISTIERRLQEDEVNGSIERFILSPYQLESFAFTKLLANWVIFCVPLLFFTPIFGLIMHFSVENILIAILSLIAGTPCLIFMGAIPATFILASKKNGSLLMVLLLVPLYVPVLIFGQAIISATLNGEPWCGQLYMLASFSLFAMALAPYALAFCWKVCAI